MSGAAGVWSVSADQPSTASPLIILSQAKALLSSEASDHREARSFSVGSHSLGDTQVPRRFSVGFHNPLRKTKGALAPKLLANLTLFGLMLFMFSIQALGQGCAQCLDSTRATPPAVQAAYRHAIILLGGFGATFFIAGALLLRKSR